MFPSDPHSLAAPLASDPVQLHSRMVCLTEVVDLLRKTAAASQPAKGLEAKLLKAMQRLAKIPALDQVRGDRAHLGIGPGKSPCLRPLVCFLLHHLFVTSAVPGSVVTLLVLYGLTYSHLEASE